MRTTVFLCAAVALAHGQTRSAIPLAGADLVLGASRDAVLAKLAVIPNAKLRELGPDWYGVQTQGPGGWITAGDVIFRDGKLTRISIHVGTSSSPAKSQPSISRDFYSSIAGLNGTLPKRVWANINSTNETPTYEVHLLFEDREIVISSTVIQGTEIASVEIYFPQILAPSQPPK